jgi:starch synthase
VILIDCKPVLRQRDSMRIVHLLRKYNPCEWGGTETAVKRLLDGLASHKVASVVYAPALKKEPAHDPFNEAGHCVKRFQAIVPVWGIKEEQKRRLISLGGNLLSFELLWQLLREPRISVIHTHTLNRLGGIALTVARLRRVPLVATIHGGVLDLPQTAKEHLLEPLRGGCEWGKLFGAVFRARQVLQLAGAIVTCNRKEAALLKEKYPAKCIIVQPHGVAAKLYREDQRAHALKAFPAIRGKRVLLVVGRIDPVKNQAWVVQQMPAILESHADTLLVLAGACTDEAYGKTLKKEIRNLGLESHVICTGGLPPGDPRLMGLYQAAVAVLSPSFSETFGLSILEAWAAGTPVIASRTSGACELIRAGENGQLFDINDSPGFLSLLNETLLRPDEASKLAQRGQQLAAAEYDTNMLAGRIKSLYERLIKERQ